MSPLRRRGADLMLTVEPLHKKMAGPSPSKTVRTAA
jgi:hypothetical protein